MSVFNRNSFLRKNAGLLFVSGGLLVIFATVVQVERQKTLETRADAIGNDHVNEWGVWFDPESVISETNGHGLVRVKLGALSEAVSHARLVLDFDPSKLRVKDVANGSVYEMVETEMGTSRVVLSSNGTFFGQGTWVTISFDLLEGSDSAEFVVNDSLSEIRYENGESASIVGSVSVARGETIELVP